MSWFQNTKTRINIVAFLPIAKDLFEKLEMAIEMVQKESGSENEPLAKEVISKILFEKSQNWKMTIDKSDILDDETKMHACRFVVGIAYNLLGGNDE